jgi:hypothetical protein
MGSEKPTRLKFADSVDALCKRPRMYTLHGTLPEIIASLEGLAKGLGLEPGYHYALSPFFEWLRQKLGKNTSRGDELLLTFGNEEAAFRELARLYREYAQLTEAKEEPR